MEGGIAKEHSKFHSEKNVHVQMGLTKTNPEFLSKKRLAMDTK